MNDEMKKVAEPQGTATSKPAQKPATSKSAAQQPKKKKYFCLKPGNAYALTSPSGIRFFPDLPVMCEDTDWLDAQKELIEEVER